MRPRYRIKSITSASGEVLTLPDKGVTCIVGSNNAGKSRLLKDIIAYEDRTSGANAPVTIAGLVASVEVLMPEELEAWMKETFHYDGNNNQYAVNAHGGMQLDHVLACQNIYPDSAHGRTSMFLRYFEAGSTRHTASSTIVPQGSEFSALGKMNKNGELIAEVSDLASEFFDSPITLDRVNIERKLKYGAIPSHIAVPPIDRPTPEYAAAVDSLEDLASQGDGIRSFLGIAMHVLTEPAQVLLFDEPESFMHPAQARALGAWMASKSVELDIQVIVATHDRDFVLGLLEAETSPRPAIVRVSRPDKITRFAPLVEQDLEDAWSDPILRYSNVLQGLFHQTVVVCEGDADCRFFAAALDARAEVVDKRYAASEVLFVPTGGKDALKKPALALSRLDVDVKVIADFDILNVGHTVRGLIAALGADWSSDMEADFVLIMKGVNAESDWKTVKKKGRDAFTEGSTILAVDRLLTALGARGLFVLPVGEMESHDLTLTPSGIKGAPWVSAALSAGLHQTDTRVSALMERMFPWKEVSSPAESVA